MKFDISTCQQADGTWTGTCYERGFDFGNHHHKALHGFTTREAALDAIKKYVDDYLRPDKTRREHGVYP